MTIPQITLLNEYPKKRWGRGKKWAIGMLFGFFVFLLTGWLASRHYHAEAEKQKELAATIQDAHALHIHSLTNNIGQDTDEDGLKDWEEVVLGTDPKNPDSDGDGVLDGEEVRMGRNPVTPEPKDYNPSTARADAGPGMVSASDTDNLTHMGIRWLIDKVLMPQMLDPNTPAPDGTQVTNSITKQVLAAADTQFSKIPYDEKSISVIDDNSAEAIKTYLEQLNASAQISMEKLKGTSELEIVAQSFQKSDFSLLSRLDPILEAYTDMLARDQVIPVPAIFAPLHLTYLNLEARQLDALRHMRNAQDDFLGSITGIKTYAATRQQLVATINELNSRASQKKPNP